MEIVVLDGYSREGVEEFIIQSLAETKSVKIQEELCPSSPIPHTRDVGASSSQSAPPGDPSGTTAESPSAAFERFSLGTLMRAVQDPQERARLEEMIQSTMWQPYED